MINTLKIEDARLHGGINAYCENYNKTFNFFFNMSLDVAEQIVKSSIILEDIKNITGPLGVLSIIFDADIEEEQLNCILYDCDNNELSSSFTLRLHSSLLNGCYITFDIVGTNEVYFTDTIPITKEFINELNIEEFLDIFLED